MLKIGVSRRTRQQKIRADKKREGSQFLFHGSQIVSAANSELGVTVNYSYIKKDLLKILLFTLLAIGAQLVLWYVSRK